MLEGVIVVVWLLMHLRTCYEASGGVLWADGSVKRAGPERSPICKMGCPTALGLFEHSLHSEGFLRTHEAGGGIGFGGAEKNVQFCPQLPVSLKPF